MSRHVPRRTCAACRGEEDREELIRLVRSPENTLVVDLRARLPGRGAWVHAARACVSELEGSPGVLARALDGPIEVAGLGEALLAAVVHALHDGLAQAAAAGGLVGGHDALLAAMAAGRVVEIAYASDAAERTRKDLVAGSAGLPQTVLPLDRDALGGQVGSAPRAAVGVLDVTATSHLRRQLRRLRGLG